MRIFIGYRNLLSRNVRYLSSKNVSYKDTLNMPKSKFASTMKNRVKCENDLRKVGKSIFSLWKTLTKKPNILFRNILSITYGNGKQNRFVVLCLLFTMVHLSPMALFTSDIFSTKSDICILQADDHLFENFRFKRILSFGISYWMDIELIFVPVGIAMVCLLNWKRCKESIPMIRIHWWFVNLVERIFCPFYERKL